MTQEEVIAGFVIMLVAVISYRFGYNHRQSVNEFEKLCRERAEYELQLAQLIEEAHEKKGTQ